MWWRSDISYIYLIVVIVNIGAFINGNFMSWTSPIIVKLNKLDDNPLNRPLTELEEALLSCIGGIGNCIGCYVSGFLAKIYGRKNTLIWMTLPSIIGCATLIFTKTYFWLMFARTIWGITIGSNLTVIPIYLGEVVDSKQRGKLSSVMSILLYVGFLFSLSAGPYTSFVLFHTLLTIIPILHILLMITLPESPYFLAQKSLSSAEDTLRKLRNTNDVKEELQMIQKYNQNKVNSTLLEILRDKGLRKGLLIGCGMIFFQQCSGISVIMSYGQKIFQEDENFLPSAWSVIIIAFMQVIFGFVAPTLVEKTGRKKLLIYSEIGIILSLLLFGFYFFMKNSSVNMDNLTWLPLVAIVSYKFMYTLGLGPVPWILSGEIFPQRMKGTAAATVATVCSWTTIVLCFSFNWMNDLVGIYGVFWCFSGIVCLALIFTLTYVFETKGKNLQEIQEIIND